MMCFCFSSRRRHTILRRDWSSDVCSSDLGLFKDKTFCVTTIVVGLVEGATPAPGAVKDGKVMLAKLKPHQREWWISIDCFGII